MVGLSMSLELRPTLCQKQEIQHKLSLTQKMSIEMYMELTEFFQGLYDKAKKETYNKHGFDFEYAAIRKKDLPKKALEFGPGFAILHCNPFSGEIDPDRPPLRFVVTDFLDDFPKEYRDLVAIHEYGESLVIGHRESSLLEWGIAKDEGILKRYLGWIAEHFPSKIADLESASKIYDMMPDELWVSAQGLSDTSEEAKRALGFIKSFDFPPEAKALAERHEVVAKEIAAGIINTGNNAMIIVDAGMPHSAFLAAYMLRKAARDIVASGIHSSISTRGTIEDAWTYSVNTVNRKHGERRFAGEQIRGQLAMESRIRSEQIQEYEAAADKPFVWYLPQSFAFAIETEKILIEEKEGATEGFQAKLEKALNLAKGKISISEENDEKNQTRPAFYIKALIFEAIEGMVESGRGSELREKKTASWFTRRVEKIGQAFEERTGQALFIGERGKIWTDCGELMRFYKSAFSLEEDKAQKVVRFARPQKAALATLAPLRIRA